MLFDLVWSAIHAVVNRFLTRFSCGARDCTECWFPLNLYVLPFQTNLPVFKVKEASVRRRYSDFEWVRNELERDSKVGVATYSPCLLNYPSCDCNWTEGFCVMYRSTWNSTPTSPHSPSLQFWTLYYSQTSLFQTRLIWNPRYFEVKRNPIGLTVIGCYLGYFETLLFWTFSSCPV